MLWCLNGYIKKKKEGKREGQTTREVEKGGIEGKRKKSEDPRFKISF